MMIARAPPAPSELLAALFDFGASASAGAGNGFTRGLASVCDLPLGCLRLSAPERFATDDLTAGRS